MIQQFDRIARLDRDGVGRGVGMIRQAAAPVINADQAGARALLADAAPRLADLAQARGLKLNASFADGQGQPSQRRDQGAPTQRAPRVNKAAAPADTQTDERIG